MRSCCAFSARRSSLAFASKKDKISKELQDLYKVSQQVEGDQVYGELVGNFSLDEKAGVEMCIPLRK
jgi:hypothetical protein